MKIRYGYEIVYACPQPTPMVLMLHTHPSRVNDLIQPDLMRTEPFVPLYLYSDVYGNTCTRLTAPTGRLTMSSDAIILDSGLPEPINFAALEHRIEELPNETLLYLMGSRYCETQLLMNEAWRLFGATPPGWQRVQTIIEFVHDYLTFGYQYARDTKTAAEAYAEKRGVCRDFAQLAITFCRCLNIPARYCSGYLGDIGVPLPDAPMDLAGWMEVYIGGAWHTFDPRNKMRRIGRILVARGRDAADAAIATTFGPCTLESFTIRCDEVIETGSAGRAAIAPVDSNAAAARMG
jgi:transglutaminase-like putative cysteine protease